jgi:hypothetical protein
LNARSLSHERGTFGQQRQASALLSINEFAELGDHSVRYSVQTERPQNFVPEATASARDVCTSNSTPEQAEPSPKVIILARRYNSICANNG